MAVLGSATSTAAVDPAASASASPTPAPDAPASVPAAPAAADLAPASQTVSARAGLAISATKTFTATGFAGTATYSVSPQLPSGLTLSTGTGVVSGTPSAPVLATTYTITADDGSATATAIITISVTKVAPSSQTLSAKAGVPIPPTASLTADGFGGAVTFSVRPTLPIGLDMSAGTGIITGTPTLAQEATRYTITASDGNTTDTADISIVIGTRITPTAQTLNLRTTFPMKPSEALLAEGFGGAVTYSILPSLPAPLFMDTTTGVITGTPVATLPTATFQITGTDGTFSDTTSVDITVVCGDALAVGPDCVVPPLAQGGANPNAAMALAAAVPDPIHGPFTTTSSDSCAACHRSHSAKSTQNLMMTASPRSGLCFTCHNGTGAGANTWTDYYSTQYPTGTARYTNVASTRTYYTHDALVATNHSGFVVDDEATSAPVDEFKATLNRHSECTDCHNPHKATMTASTQTTTGWTAGGMVAGATGVSVVNGAAGATPTYTLLGSAGSPITREYQLCLKCHSGYTTLPSNASFTGSKWFLDKGVEFNPNNLSMHPVEAVGKNSTAAMGLSLSSANVNGTLGAAPTKRWNFLTTSTVRCTHCHASGSTGTVPNAPHVSANAGILIAPYRSQLKTGAYSTSDFNLCWSCHTNVPFESQTTSATNFGDLHNKHVKSLGNGSGGDIDTPGAGTGNAICAECHYRLHSTATQLSAATRASTQTITGNRLVSFSPNVTGGTGGPVYNQATRTCTLVCHGKSHTGWTY